LQTAENPQLVPNRFNTNVIARKAKNNGAKIGCGRNDIVILSFIGVVEAAAANLEVGVNLGNYF
jgi:hypothetical protein